MSNIEERVKTLENDLKTTREELRQVLLDIRSFVLEAENPLRAFERQAASQNDSEKEDNGG
ncbi:MAG: hypothetical protein Q8O05_02515 [Chloroflexota bacterium]|nr:hypothetical protein [Chloroflexota bacterium]